MNAKVLRLLEFDTIRSRVADRCLSVEATALMGEEDILVDPTAVSILKESVAQFVALLMSTNAQPSLSLPAIGPLLPRLGKEGVSLELEEAYALGLFTDSASALGKWLSGEAVGELLKEAASHLPDCSSVSKEVFAVLERDGTLRDLPSFREIKRRISGLRKELENITNRYLSDDETRRMLQSEVATQRDGRLVLALKANYRSRIKGIVHEVSATGQTIFVEPEEVVEKNNNILMEERRLAAEVARVLRELTARIGEKKDELVELRERVLELDRLRARARYALDAKGFFADAPCGRLALKGARHPMLGTNAVPIDLSMDSATRVVIVTGPNTGGKTVALKTVGLFALMNQFGLALPVSEGTTLPIFDGVYADIGDEQSISQSLSTFSAHMTNMASICGIATENSLVLLDELGSGTDPEEGSAIAMSLLDLFIERRSRVLTTTHHGILKNYGYTKEGVVNASVDFDSRTLSPTYRIVIGIPGESHALDIAARNGLPEAIVSRARTYLDEERADISELIKGLKTKHRELEKVEEDHKSQETLLRDQQRKNDLRELRLKQKEAELRSLGVGSLNRLLGESRKTLENLVRELREGDITREKTLRVKEFLADLERSAAEESSRRDEEADSLYREERTLKKEPENKPTEESSEMAPSKIVAGVEVFTGPSRRRGVVVRGAKKGFWVVEIGAMKMTLAERDLIPAVKKAETGRVEIMVADLAGGAAPVLELNLRGYRWEEALDALRRQVDSAAISGLYEFSVIHGKGDGVLQRAVHEYLKSQAVVADYYFARPEDGGYGKTFVVLKR
ncbi:MAG: endonuclease MutS2 [Treponemataceae bacterium]